MARECCTDFIFKFGGSWGQGEGMDPVTTESLESWRLKCSENIHVYSGIDRSSGCCSDISFYNGTTIDKPRVDMKIG